MTDTDLQRRADEHLAEVRRRLADFLTARMTADKITHAELGQRFGYHKDSGKNMVWRMTKPDDPEYPNSRIEPMMLALTWLDLSLGDLDPKHIRPTQVGDVSQAIMELDLDEDDKIELRIMFETHYTLVNKRETR